MLRRGATGREVRDLQSALLRRGINPGPLDGVFGPRTESAVRRLQEVEALATDGIAGPETLAALGTASQDE
jgi:peptidoglycan hydrolase-like protein with peptidoglycan-binding domain